MRFDPSVRGRGREPCLIAVERAFRELFLRAREGEGRGGVTCASCCTQWGSPYPTRDYICPNGLLEVLPRQSTLVSARAAVDRPPSRYPLSILWNVFFPRIGHNVLRYVPGLNFQYQWSFDEQKAREAEAAAEAASK